MKRPGQSRFVAAEMIFFLLQQGCDRYTHSAAGQNTADVRALLRPRRGEGRLDTNGRVDKTLAPII